MDNIIPMKHFTNPHTTNMLYWTFTGDDDSHYFETPIKQNHSGTAKRFHVSLRSDFMQYQHAITHNITSQKLSSYGEEYHCFQTDVETAQAEQCSKSIPLTKFIE